MLDRFTVSPQLLTAPDTCAAGGKLDRLGFDLATLSRPTLVVAHHRSVVEACARVSRKLGKSTAVIHGGTNPQAAGILIDQFKRGRIDVLCGSIYRLAEGLQLTAADTVIIVQKTFSPHKNEQIVRRVHRLGQSHPVTCMEYITPKTIDSKRERLLADKTDQQVRVLTAAELVKYL